MIDDFFVQVCRFWSNQIDIGNVTIKDSFHKKLPLRSEKLQLLKHILPFAQSILKTQDCWDFREKEGG